MTTTRRNFIKGISCTSGAIGLSSVPMFSCLPKHSKELKSSEVESKQILEASDNSFIAETNYGKIRGYRKNGICTFKGIPYGDSTAGANRFMAPQKPKPWAKVRNTMYFGPAAPQEAGRYGNVNLYGEPDFDLYCTTFAYEWGNKCFSEDCLRINVWTPSIDDSIKRPVLVWFHGGGFSGGSSSDLDAYHGENLSMVGDVVVCTINHRLNGFGFLNLAEVGGEKYTNSANAGMLDCVAALEWVRDNISNFGGDPGNVTIFGQSGGGGKVSILMAMPSAKGLFHKAMIISGATLKIAEFGDEAALGYAVLKEAGITPGQIERLQMLPWMDCYDILMAAQKRMADNNPGTRIGRFRPCVDKLHIPRHPFYSSAPEISGGIPMIVGSCLNERSPSINNPELESITIDGVKEKLDTKFKGNAGEIVDAYAKIYPNRKPIEIWSMIDWWEMRTNAISLAEKQTANNGIVYNYWFAWNTPLYGGRPRAHHNSDLAFWFNNTDLMDTITGGGERPKRLAEKMSRALVNFARNGNPNHEDIPYWPKYSIENRSVMIWDDTCEIKNDPDLKARKLLENKMKFIG